MQHLLPQSNNKSSHKDELAILVEDIEHAINENTLERAASLFAEDIAATWFAFHPAKTQEILGLLVGELDDPPPIISAAHHILTATTADLIHTRELMESLDTDDHGQIFTLSMFRMADFRLHGRIVEALEQAENAEHYIAQLRPGLDPHSGWVVHAALEIGVTAMLAGDSTRALSSFTKAQMYSATPRFGFLGRDAIVKSALIHACFGNASTAMA